MDKFKKLCKEYELDDEQISKLQATLPEKEVDLDKYIPKKTIQKKYITKEKSNEIIQDRLSEMAMKKNEVETEVAELKSELKKYDEIDLEQYEELQTRVKQFENQTIEKAQDYIGKINELDNDKIREKFSIPDEEDDIDFGNANKIVDKYEEYKELGLFGSKPKPEDKKGHGQNTEWKDDPIFNRGK